jgi:hypothetical protein
VEASEDVSRAFQEEEQSKRLMRSLPLTLGPIQQHRNPQEDRDRCWEFWRKYPGSWTFTKPLYSFFSRLLCRAGVCALPIRQLLSS